MPPKIFLNRFAVDNRRWRVFVTLRWGMYRQWALLPAIIYLPGDYHWDARLSFHFLKLTLEFNKL